jgi:subtilisin-like proprotein convertase family protein
MDICLSDHVQATFHGRITIPDNSPPGVILGPLCTASKRRLEDVVLAISVSHPDTGDLALALQYDADRDGRPDASSPVEIHLARRALCFGEEAWACPIQLSGTYFFRDGGWRAVGECASFEVFRGLPAGGDWYLSIVDSEPDHVGTVSEWSIYAETSDEDLEARQVSIEEREATCP